MINYSKLIIVTIIVDYSKLVIRMINYSKLFELFKVYLFKLPLFEVIRMTELFEGKIDVYSVTRIFNNICIL